MPTEAEVIDALRPVEDPEIRQSIVDLEMVRGIVVQGDQVGVTVALTVAGCPLKAEITKRVTDAVSALADVGHVNVDLTVGQNVAYPLTVRKVDKAAQAKG